MLVVSKDADDFFSKLIKFNCGFLFGYLGCIVFGLNRLNLLVHFADFDTFVFFFEKFDFFPLHCVLLEQVLFFGSECFHVLFQLVALLVFVSESFVETRVLFLHTLYVVFKIYNLLFSVFNVSVSLLIVLIELLLQLPVLNGQLNNIFGSVREHLGQILNFFVHALSQKFYLRLKLFLLVFHLLFVHFLQLLALVVLLFVFVLILFQTLVSFRWIVIIISICTCFFLNYALQKINPIIQFFIDNFKLIIFSLRPFIFVN